MRSTIGALSRRAASRRPFASSVLFALFLAVSLFAVPLRAFAAPPGVVTPNNPDGWQPANVRANATVSITTAQPRGDAPNNNGSLEFTTNTVTSGQDKADYAKYWGVVPGRTLGNLSALGYELYRASSSTTAQHFAPAFRLAYATPSGDTGYLIWEHVYNGGNTSTPVPTDQWLSKDIFGGNFWMRTFNPGFTVTQYDVTLAEWQSGVAFPSSDVLGPDTNIIGIETGVGSGWGNSFRGFVDNVVADFNGDSVSANFEPAPQCTTDCYVDDDTGNDANGGTGFADAKRTIQAGVTQVSSGGTVHVKDGVYDEAITINKPLTLEGAQHGVVAKGRAGAEAIIQLTTNQTPVTINASNVTVDGFTFDVGQQRMPWAIIALGQASYSNLEVRNNLFTGNPGTGDPNQDAGGAYVQNTINTLIEGNFFNGLGSHAIFMAGSSNGTVYRNNDSYRNKLSNFSAHVGPHTNTLVENNRAVEDSLIVFATDGLTIKNNSYQASSTLSSRLYLGGGDKHITVTGNTFTDMRAQAIQIFDAGFGYGPNSDATITNNMITTNVATQIAGGWSLIDLRDVGGTSQVSGNTIALSGSFASGVTNIYGIGVRGNTATVNITANTLDGGNVDSDASTPSSGILLRSTLAASSVINAQNNVVTGFSIGVEAQALAAGVQATFFNNNLGGNSAKAVANAGGAGNAIINASGNWPGSNTFAGASAATTPGSVDYTPFLNNATDTSGAAGFQGDFSTLNVDDDSAQADPTGRVQEGVNLLAAPGTINVAAGSYTEQVVINKDGVTVHGAGAAQTTLQGVNCSGRGFELSGSRNNITINNLAVTGYEYGFFLGTIGDSYTDITIEDVSASSNCRHGIFSQAGTLSGITINRVNASGNGNAGSSGRGVWLINGTKSDVSVTDGTFSNNNLVGVDVSDGNVTGLTITGNTVNGNGDAGIAVLGAQGPKANLIDNNALANNGRFGIEIKVPNGNGAISGAGSVVVSNNLVSRSVAATDGRDHAGIAVIRRSGNVAFNADQPAGVAILNNEVNGYRRAAFAPANQDGFGIVVEGTNHTIKNNIVGNNDVGVQVQGTCSGDQNAADPCFGRGNAANGAATVKLNAITANDIGLRLVGGAAVTAFDGTQNWWNSATGPTNPANPGGTGDSAVNTTNFRPWLCDGTDTAAARGFQPNITNCGVATGLVFSTQPGNGTETTPLAPQPVVKAVDSVGNVDTTFSGAVALALGANPSGATLNGTSTVNASGGVATFSGLIVNKVGVGYTLVASSSGVASATSSPFNVLDGGLTCSTILDNFNRKDGVLGSSRWTGNEGYGGYTIRSNQVQVLGGGPIFWKSTNFGSDQYACKKLAKVDIAGTEQSLMLKVQGNKPDWRNGVIDVNYVFQNGQSYVVVDTYQPGNRGPFNGWREYTPIPVTFNNGDVFAARALADGTVRMYKNGTLIGVTDTKGASLAANRTPTFSGNGTYFVNKGGRIGVWDINAQNAKFDDFGGGNVRP